MTHPLDGAFLKVTRAKKHLEELKAELSRIGESVLASLLTETVFDAATQEFHVRIVRGAEVPSQLSLIVGDVVQNLRTALEFLVYELVRLDHGFYIRGTQFPLVSKMAEMANCEKTLKYLSPDSRALIEWHQPFDSVSDSGYDWWPHLVRNSVLGTLRDLSNRDKHRLLIEHWVYPYTESPPPLTSGLEGAMMPLAEHVAEFEARRTFFFNQIRSILIVTPLKDCRDPFIRVFQGTLEKDATIAVLGATIDGPDPQMQVDLNVRPTIAITDTLGEGTETLDLIGAKVVEVLRDFEPFFE
ncbi:MAG: hypothetical protein M3P18_14560 [Actinomycetota bacterium]|nr:hypothetical protein [Actinomycetota bacterium]